MFSREVIDPSSSPSAERPVVCHGRHEQAAAVVVSRVDVHETTAVRILNVMNEGIGSVREVDFLAHGIARPSSTLLSLSLHSNRVSSLEGLASLTVSYDMLLLLALFASLLMVRVQNSIAACCSRSVTFCCCLFSADYVLLLCPTP